MKWYPPSGSDGRCGLPGGRISRAKASGRVPPAVIANRRSSAATDRPLWFSTAAPGPLLAPLRGQSETDVLVIGGGIAGATTALHLAERGVEVALVEGDQPGGGATGQSGGLVAPDYIRHSPNTIRDTLGAEAGARLTRMIGDSAGFVFDLIDKHGIDCDPRQDGFYTPAHTGVMAKNQRAHADQWRALGYDVEFVEAAASERLFGSQRYSGALRFAAGGSLNPLGYVRGIVRAALDGGARVFADSRVISLQRRGGTWVCRTREGTIRSRRLVLAANGGNAALHPAMARTSLPLHVVQFATAPLSPQERMATLPEGGAFTDKRPYLFTARTDGLGHLISGYPTTLFVRSERAQCREAERRLRQNFAALPDPEISHLWRGLAWVNTSLLPEVYDLGDEAIAIQACNGRGIATNTALGAEVAEMLATGDREVLSVKPSRPEPIRFHAIAALLPKLLMSLAYISD